MRRYIKYLLVSLIFSTMFFVCSYPTGVENFPGRWRSIKSHLRTPLAARTLTAATGLFILLGLFQGIKGISSDGSEEAAA